MLKLFNDDCINILSKATEGSVDAIICDPPYGIKFMAKRWDDTCPSVDIWRECLRVMKDGGHIMAFSGTRTIDLIMGRMREAGFEIRDTLTWLYGSGFPKSYNIEKALKKIGKDLPEYNGYGTALKPACEFIVLGRKPFKGNVVDNVLKYGTGGINIDISRIETNEVIESGRSNRKECISASYDKKLNSTIKATNTKGRFPANLILDDEAAKMLDVDSDNTSRFFKRFKYQAKASKRERGENNNHPTVKPIALMEYLITMITPPSGIVLDPFMGSGSTGVAARKLDYGFIGIERDADYFEIAKRRIESVKHGV